MNTFSTKLSHFTNSLFLIKPSISPFLNYMIYHAKPFWIQLLYFMVISTIGYLAMKVSKPRTMNNDLNNLNIFFTSVSATTVSSMSTVEMEVFSNFQLIVMTLQMLLGSEVFTSLLGLLFQRYKMYSNQNKNLENKSDIISSIELGSININPTSIELGSFNKNPWDKSNTKDSFVVYDNLKVSKYDCIKSLGYVVLGYHVIVHAIGITLVTMYIALTPSANNVLKTKGLVLETFSFFVVISTFSNCGFIPTNENMMVFRKNSGLLLILIPQIFLGNTLYGPCLRFVICVLEKFTKRKEYTYMLKNYKDLDYGGLISSQKSWYLVGTVLVLYVLQIGFFSAMEWSSSVMDGMTWYEKFVGSLFQTANSRHAGESIVDLSMVSSAILVLFIIMMYLPSCFSFLPIGHQQEEVAQDNNNTKKKQQKNNIKENLLAVSQLSYMAIFVILICITERKSLKEDPLNFDVLSIVFEVISAYGNVGTSMGYSCKRQLKADANCQDKMYGFVGRWSNPGKVVLIIVMFFGRLKKFNLYGGKAWTMQ